MRDKGFDFQWYDKYCTNLFAKHFNKNRAYYDLVTAYEVLEHLPNPVTDIEEMLSCGDNLLFSTCLIPSNVRSISDWGYFAPNHGQHISFYTKESLCVLAKKFDRQYVGYGDMHMFMKEKCSHFRFSLGCRFFSLIEKVQRRESLLMADYNMIVNNTAE